MPINYIICAAGRGSRFAKDYPGIPKPAIELEGKYLLQWSCESLDFQDGDKLIIITQKEHREGLKQAIASVKDEIAAKFEWLELGALTGGQLETALQAKPLLDMNSSIAIFNCDTYYRSDNFLKLSQDQSIEGIIPCADVPGESWSFCEVDEHNIVKAVAEKKRISNWASVGMYYFRDAGRFIKMAEDYIASNQEAETYVAPFYQSYLDRGFKISMDPVSLFKPMGTPEQIKDYW